MKKIFVYALIALILAIGTYQFVIIKSNNANIEGNRVVPTSDTRYIPINAVEYIA
jgi:hypothetical protein